MLTSFSEPACPYPGCPQAPEVQRCEPYNQAADTFSFGVLAYELLSRSMLVFTHLGGGMLPGVLTPGNPYFW
ncbi:predicted protein [Haematococcus lacustris]|uniref:Protein kinase domain-containing protein n=1 Tax=Haematococcus lacustris TaxID=44745 RepID=A0A699YAX0_HAELA|nr:predicted protein [Haematococcus lacustris]